MESNANTLPLDILSSIFDKVDFGDLRSLLLVNKAWNEASYRSKLWNGNKLSGQPNDKISKKYANFPEEVLIISGQPRADDVVKVLGKIERVTSLIFQTDPKDILQKLATSPFSCKYITVIFEGNPARYLGHIPSGVDTIYCRFNPAYLESNRLQIPQMNGVKNLSFQQAGGHGIPITFDVKHAMSIESLELIGCWGTLLFPQCMPNLRAMLLTIIKENLALDMNMFPQLEELNFYGGRLDFLGNSPTLKKLTLSQCFTDSPAPLVPDRVCPNLTFLRSKSHVEGWVQCPPGSEYKDEWGRGS